MDEQTQRRSAAEFKRRRHLRTGNPFCRICGKSHLWANYHRHHTDLRAHSPDMIFICEDCHNEVHAMLRDYPPIPANVPESRHSLIHMARGQMAIARLSLKKWAEMEQWLLNDIDLPPAPATNDNGSGGDGGAGSVPGQPSIMAMLDAQWGSIDKEDAS